MISRDPRPSPPPGFVNRPPARPMPPPWMQPPQPGMNVPLPPSTHDRPQWAGPGMIGEPVVDGYPDQPVPNPYAERMAAYLRLMARRG